MRLIYLPTCWCLSQWRQLKQLASSNTSPVQILLQGLALIQAQIIQIYSLQQINHKLIHLSMLLEIWICRELHTNRPCYLLFSLGMFCMKGISMVQRVWPSGKMLQPGEFPASPPYPTSCLPLRCLSQWKKNTWPPSSFTSSFIAGNFSGLHASSIQLILCNTIHVFTALPFSVFPYKWCNVGLNWHFCLDIVSLRKRYVLCSFVQLAWRQPENAKGCSPDQNIMPVSDHLVYALDENIERPISGPCAATQFQLPPTQQDNVEGPGSLDSKPTFLTSFSNSTDGTGSSSYHMILHGGYPYRTWTAQQVYTLQIKRCFTFCVITPQPLPNIVLILHCLSFPSSTPTIADLSFFKSQ